MISPPTTLALTFVAAAAIAFAGYSQRSAEPFVVVPPAPVPAVSSLSRQDIDGFLAGAGMGLAKSAELNGVPGPMHVLELAKELELTDEQRSRVTASMDALKVKARELGGRYVDAEQALAEAIRDGATRELIVARVEVASKLLSELRLAHLEAHVETAPLLTPKQRKHYAELRGHAAGDGQHGPGPTKH